MRVRNRFAAAAAGLVLAGGVAFASAPGAQVAEVCSASPCNGNGGVNGNVTVNGTFTFTVTNPSFSFGNANAGSTVTSPTTGSVPTATVMTNDPAGYQITSAMDPNR